MKPCKKNMQNASLKKHEGREARRRTHAATDFTALAWPR